MPKKYTSEQFWKLYRKLPEELQGAILAEETGDTILDVCKRYEIMKHHFDMIEYIGQVLTGVLPLDEFQETIEKELKLKKEIAKKVAGEIYRFVFYPVKESLEELYKIEIAPLAKMKVTPTRQEKPPTPPKKEDVYREPVK